MCNEFAQERAWREYCEMMQADALDIIYPGEEPELPYGSIRPSERAAIIRAAPGGTKLELLNWGWTPYGGKGLVINIRTEGRKDPPASRGIAFFDRFYEFQGAKPPKSKFEFTPAANEPLAFGVLVRNDKFALMTCEPGPDVAEIHGRQPTVLRASDWRRWLTDAEWPGDLAQPSTMGTLKSLQVR